MARLEKLDLVVPEVEDYDGTKEFAIEYAKISSVIATRDVKNVRDCINEYTKNGRGIDMETVVRLCASFGTADVMREILKLIYKHNTYDDRFMLPVDDILISCRNTRDQSVYNMFSPYKGKVLHYNYTFVGIFENPVEHGREHAQFVYYDDYVISRKIPIFVFVTHRTLSQTLEILDEENAEDESFIDEDSSNKDDLEKRTSENHAYVKELLSRPDLFENVTPIPYDTY